MNAPQGPAAAGGPSGNDQPPQRSSRATVLVVVLGAGLLLAALAVVMNALTTRARDAVVDADFIELGSPISGQLMELRVDAGSPVQAGEDLARVQNPRASDSDVRQLRTALNTAEARLDELDHELSLQRQLAGEFSRNAGDQKTLEIARINHELDQLHAEQARERQELAFSQRDLQRQEALFKAGAVSEMVVDRARTAVAKNLNQRRAIEAQIRAQTDRRQAAERNLNLDRTRSVTDPLPRLQEARLQLARLDGERLAAQRQIKGLQAQLGTATGLFAKQSNVWIKAPVPAVVWRIQARTGDSLRTQQPVLRLVRCSHRWVSTYVAENDLNRLRIGTRARIDLIGEDLDLRGQVDLIRSGVGRIAANSNEPAPPAVTLARQSQVRVRIDTDVPAPPSKLCFVGYSARVIFQ